MANSIAFLDFYHRGRRGAQGFNGQRITSYFWDLSLYFLRSIRNRASSFNGSARSPKLSNSANAW